MQVRLSSDPVPREELEGVPVTVGVACTPAIDGTAHYVQFLYQNVTR